MPKFKCLIIEDEPIAARVLAKFIEPLAQLEVVATCHHAIAGLEVLQQHPIDLLFLDIKMPQLSGLELLRILKQVPKVIITTAHAEYALEGYELNIVDYLLKPIAEARFMKAVNKALQQIPLPVTPSFDYTTPYIYLKADKKMVQVFLQDILYLESMGNYVKVYTTDKMIVTYQTLQFFEQHLPPELFLRIHRSYIISLNQIEAYSATFVELPAQLKLPIGQNYKVRVLQFLAQER
ncbi:MAG TPA: DNA-binding response regulator [Microscillaceae bacterium]|nr:DNA-binding response regulator [Microscillaceae bacterium]